MSFAQAHKWCITEADQILDIRVVYDAHCGNKKSLKYACINRALYCIVQRLIIYMCVYVCVHTFLGPAQFSTCENGRNPQGGCLGSDMLNPSTEDQSVTFDVSVMHRNASLYCFTQVIRVVTLEKDGEVLVRCSVEGCMPINGNGSRFNFSETMREFNTTMIMLEEPKVSDSGVYVAIADIRRPSDNVRMCIYKNFSLTVKGNTLIILI